MKEYPKHVMASGRPPGVEIKGDPPPVGEYVTANSAEEEAAVLNGTAIYRTVLAAGGFGQSGNTYTIIGIKGKEYK